MRKLVPAFAAILLFSAVQFAEADDDAKPFATATDIDLTLILPPPPPDDSAKTKEEIAEVLTLQITRTPEMAARATADDEETVWRFADVMGPDFSKEKLPKLSAFFDRVAATEGAVVDPAKKVFHRPRPHMLSNLITPIVELSKSGAWPSGHTTLGTMEGIILGDMVPEKRTEIMARAWEYGNNRVVAGIHYPSDVEMGRISGSVIAATIMGHDDFKTEYEAAKAELRTGMGM